MKELQEQIFNDTEELIGNFSIIRVIIYSLISAGIIIVLLYAFSIEVNYLTGLLSIVVSFAYVFIRDKLWNRRTHKFILNNYNYLKTKRPGMSLFVPIFSGTRSGLFLKKAAIFYHNKQLYIEAFQYALLGKEPKDSITLKFGDDFILGESNIGFNEKVLTYKAKLMETDYEFSVINIKSLIDLLESSKGDK